MIYATRPEVDGAIGDMIRSLVVEPPTGTEFMVMVGVVRAAAVYSDHAGTNAYSPASIEAAVYSAAFADGLELRNTLLEALRLSLAGP